MNTGLAGSGPLMGTMGITGAVGLSNTTSNTKVGQKDFERLPDEVVEELYQWMDSIPLSRPKRCIARDFSDGVLFAELIAYYHPKLVELHNYSAANGVSQKRYNWATICQRPLRKLKVKPDPELIEAIVEAKPNAIEHLLYLVHPVLLPGSGEDARNAAVSRSMGTTGRAKPVTLSAISETSSRLKAPPLPPNPFVPSSVSNNPINSTATIFGGQSSISGTGMAGTSGYQTYQSGPVSDTGTVRALQEQITELRDMNGLLEAKVAKLQQLVRLKDERIKALVEKLEELGQ